MQKLIKQSLEVQNDTMVTARNVVTRTNMLNPADRGIMDEQESNKAKATSPNPLKLSQKKNPPVKIAEKPKQAEKKAPKAVMKKKN